MKQIIGVTAESGIDHLPAMGSDVLQQQLVIMR